MLDKAKKPFWKRWYDAFWGSLRCVRAWSYIDPLFCHHFAMRTSVLKMLHQGQDADAWHRLGVWIAMREDWPGWRERWRKTFPQWAPDSTSKESRP